MLFNADRDTKNNILNQIKRDADEYRERKLLDVLSITK